MSPTIENGEVVLVDRLIVDMKTPSRGTVVAFKHFISSKKFMKAEGGIERIVWMPKELKEFVAERLNKTAQELYGIENFTDMIGDETVATDPEALVEFLTEKGHPALSMEPMM